MGESLFDELKRYARFDSEDAASLLRFAPTAAAHEIEIVDSFYYRLSQHEEAAAVITSPEQVKRLKGMLITWMRELFEGPWDDVYYDRRARIGRMHVRIGLPQRYMFAAMNVLRTDLCEVVRATGADDDEARSVLGALHKILDIELAIMLETYAEAFVDRLRAAERERRVVLEAQLALSQARYQEIVEEGPALITTSDTQGNIVLFNAQCEHITGIDRAQAQGRRWLDVFVAASDQEVVAERQRLAATRQVVKPYEGHIAGIAKPVVVRWHFTTFPGSDNPIVCAIGIDVTSEHDLAIRTRRAERLAGLGTLAAGLAHEIRNPLNAAQLQLNLAQRKVAAATGGDAAASALQLAENEMRRLAVLVDEFLAFARPHPLTKRPTDLRVTVEETAALIAPEAETKGVKLTTSCGPSSCRTEVDEEKIRQVLLNLVRNAVEAAGQGGTVHVGLAQTNEEIQLEVADSGPGFASDAPLFEPFYTTKTEGTGLGLAIAHRIVIEHGGQIDARPSPGNTVFEVRLPAT